MNSVLDVQRLLRRYGIIVYTGKRANDLVWMEEELKELYRANLLQAEDFQRALLILQKEKGSFME
ncbi:MAG TPA: YqgQ family protein [Pseudogracilibacillus sp.]|nr:YqgQ family protein [Pseudogracilibacillus sp.]